MMGTVNARFRRARRWRVATAMMVTLITGNVYAASLNGFDLGSTLVPRGEIVAGGPPRDGIPALIDPKRVSAGHAVFLRAGDRVLGVVIGGEAVAYPVRIMNWHELVNDRVGTQYFVVSYCPLCGSGMVFATNVGDKRLIFGVSGLLYNSDVLLYDAATESLWSQLMGEAISGKLKGTHLPQLVAYNTTWRAWRKAHPETKVMSTETGYRRDYNRSPYLGYEKSPRLYFRVEHRAPHAYRPKELTLGVSIGDLHKAYPFAELAKQGLDHFDDQLGTAEYIVHWDAKARSAYITGKHGEKIASVTAYWFAWYAFHPDTLVFNSGKK